jgi:hypothetical protein
MLLVSVAVLAYASVAFAERDTAGGIGTATGMIFRVGFPY